MDDVTVLNVIDLVFIETALVDINLTEEEIYETAQYDSWATAIVNSSEIPEVKG